jgi:hypothetical protein
VGIPQRHSTDEAAEQGGASSPLTRMGSGFKMCTQVNTYGDRQSRHS